MGPFCENPLCENEATKRVCVSRNRAGDGQRWLCPACEEVFTWGVRHGHMATLETLQGQQKEKSRIIQALRSCLTRTCKTIREALEGVWDGNIEGWEAVMFDIERTMRNPLGKKGVAKND
jgi:hypothetical protein